MLIADRLYKKKEFPLIPTKNMNDLAKAVKASQYASSGDIAFCNLIINAYANQATIEFYQWEKLSYLFDTYIGNQCLINLIK